MTYGTSWPFQNLEDAFGPCHPGDVIVIGGYTDAGMDGLLEICRHHVLGMDDASGLGPMVEQERGARRARAGDEQAQASGLQDLTETGGLE